MDATVQWKNVHLPGCPVTRNRENLLADRETMDPAVFEGCVREHDMHGDEEGEHCICSRPDLLALNVLADEILESSNGPVVYASLAHYLTHQQMIDLGAKCELCPVHYCDEQICRDDQNHCYEE